MSTTADRAAVLACCAAPVIISVDYAAISVQAPAIRADLGLSAAGLAWLISGYSLSYGAFLLIAGRCADVYGRKRVLLVGLTLFATAAAIVCAAATGAVALGARVVQGGGAAAMLAAAVSMLTAGRDRGRAAAAYGSAVGAGFVAGTLASGTLAALGTWRLGMAVTIPCCAVAAAAAARIPRERTAADRALPRWSAAIGVGALVATGAAAPLLPAPAAALGPATATAGLLAFAARLGAGVANAPRRLPVACAVSLTLTGSCVAAVLLVSVDLQQDGHGPLTTSAVLASFGLAAVPAGRASRRAARRWAPAPLVASGLAVQGAALLALAVAGDLLHVAAALAALGFGHVLGHAGTAAVATAEAPPARHGVIAGTLGAGQRLGGALGPLLAADAAAFPRAVALLGAAALAVAVLAWLLLDGQGKFWPLTNRVVK